MGRVQVIVPACFYILAGEAFSTLYEKGRRSFQFYKKSTKEIQEDKTGEYIWKMKE